MKEPQQTTLREIHHDENECKFWMEADGHRAYVQYRIDNGIFDIRHTIVPEAIGGRGIASALVKAAYTYALTHRLKLVATCSYAVMWLQRHPEFEGSAGDDYAGQGTCALS